MKIQRIKAVIVENLFYLRHSLEEVTDTFFWPMMDMIIWGFTTRYFAKLSSVGAMGMVISFLLGALILWNIVWRAQQDISVSFLRDVWSSNLLNLFASPLTPWEFLAGTMILGFIKILATLFLVAGIALVFYSFNLFLLGFYLLPFFGLLLWFAWISGLFITGLIVNLGMKIQALAWSLVGFLHPLSCVFYPLSSLPPILQRLAVCLPTTHVFEGMREVLAGSSGIEGHLVWAFILNIFYSVLAILFFRAMFERAREKGRLAKFEE